MFRRCGASAVVAMLLAAGCAGERTSSPPITEPGASATTPSLVPSTTAEVEVTRAESTVPASTEPAPTSTSTISTVGLQSVTDFAVLRPNGLGSVDFGTPADEALEELSALLGPPDLVESIAPMGEGGDGCVVGAGWLDCLRSLRIVDEGQLVVWASYGLEVALVDTSREAWPRERTSLQLGDWHATIASGDVRPVTEEGLYPGITVRELRQLVPWVHFSYHEGTLDKFNVTFGERGYYWGRLDWNPDTDSIDRWDVGAVQAALNEHGADLAVDGEWGHRSEAAWLDFLAELGIKSPTLAATWPLWLTREIGEALGLPPDDIVVATIGPGPPINAADAQLSLTLRPDGLGPVDFGTPAEEAVEQLTVLLGPADRDTPIAPGSNCTDESSGLLKCMADWRVIDAGRLVGWDDFGLVVVFVDSKRDGSEPRRIPLHVATWHAGPPGRSDVRLTTVEGFYPGMTIGQLGQRSGVEGLYDEGSLVGYHVESPSDGGYYGGLDTDPSAAGHEHGDQVRAIQAALNARGADLVVDGIWGPRSEAAWEAFLQQHQIEPVAPTFVPWLVSEIGNALGLPTDDMAITSISPTPR